MSKKDYELIARILRDRRPLAEREAPKVGRVSIGNVAIDAANDTVDGIARDFADVLAADNPRFNRATFMRACGMSAALDRDMRAEVSK